MPNLTWNNPETFYNGFLRGWGRCSSSPPGFRKVNVDEWARLRLHGVFGSTPHLHCSLHLPMYESPCSIVIALHTW